MNLSATRQAMETLGNALSPGIIGSDLVADTIALMSGQQFSCVHSILIQTIPRTGVLFLDV